MKIKDVVNSKVQSPEKLNPKGKPKSLRPMRSMLAVRSLKPRTVATMIIKSDEIFERN